MVRNPETSMDFKVMKINFLTLQGNLNGTQNILKISYLVSYSVKRLT
jgi:hypothetical protein